MKSAFLSVDEILEIHAFQIERFGGADGIRDEELLRSTAAMPMATFGGEYLHRGLFEMAAAYLFHIVQNHPFIDGNKRTGAMAAAVFLDMNGIALDVDDDDFTAMVLSVASGEMDKEAICAFLKSHAKGQ